MAEDLSALDAELDRLGTPPVADPTALASAYAGKLGPLTEIDTLLNQLAAPVGTLELPGPPRMVSIPPPLPEAPDAALQSEEIVLPDQVVERSEQSGELPLEGLEAAQSGAFALPPEPAARAEGVRSDDLTMDAELEELVEFDVEDDPDKTLFEPFPERISETDRVVDAEFAEIFESGTTPEVATPEDDTEVFDSSALSALNARAELEPIENAFTAEELDSAEFEIVMESTETPQAESTTSSIPPHPSSRPPPEKRPSFLGRLFGRKDE